VVLPGCALAGVACPRPGCSRPRCATLESQDFGFAQDRRTIVRIGPQSCRLSGRATHRCSTSTYPRFDSRAFRGCRRWLSASGSPLSGNELERLALWVDGRPAPGPKDDNMAAFWGRVTAGYSRRHRNAHHQRARHLPSWILATSQHVAVINQAFAQEVFQAGGPHRKAFRAV
jgi:hypothetical protein